MNDVISGKTQTISSSRYTTLIRSIHLSPVFIHNTAIISRNEQHIKQIFKSLEKRSIIRSDTSLIKTSVSKCQAIWQRIIHESKYYYRGCKLLFVETKIAFRLGRQVFNGHTLTRRERKQVRMRYKKNFYFQFFVVDSNNG